MAIYFGVPILALAAIIQASMIATLFPSGGGPQLVFLCVLSWAINADLRDGLTWAFIGGITLDLLSAAPLGTSVIGLILVVFLISGLGGQLYGVGLPLLGALTVTGTLVTQISVFALVLILARIGFMGFPESAQGLPFVTDLTSTILSTMIYNLVMIWPTYWFIRRLQGRIERRDE